MRNFFLLSAVMLAVIFGCANQQKDDTDKEAGETQAEITVVTEEVSLNVSGMV